MSRAITIAIVLVVVAGLAAFGMFFDRYSPSDTPAPTAGTAYGQALAGAPVVTIKDLLAKPADYEGKTVRVEGVVSAVCPKRGCWIKLAGNDAAGELTFKVTDGVIVFPMSAAGKHASAEGVVFRKDLTLEETRQVLGHEAEEQGKPFDPASVTGPMTYVRLNGLGAVVSDRN